MYLSQYINSVRNRFNVHGLVVDCKPISCRLYIREEPFTDAEFACTSKHSNIPARCGQLKIAS